MFDCGHSSLYQGAEQILLNTGDLGDKNKNLI